MSGMRSAAARLLWRNPAGRAAAVQRRGLDLPPQLALGGEHHLRRAAPQRLGALRGGTGQRLEIRGLECKRQRGRHAAKEVVLVPLVPHDVVGRLPQPGDAHRLQPIRRPGGLRIP